MKKVKYDPNNRTFIYEINSLEKLQLSWHHQVIAKKLDDVINGKIKKIMFLAPPRHGKTELISSHLPGFFLNNYPEKAAILVTYSHELADQLGQGLKARDRLLALGSGGSTSGYAADLILIDDPIKRFNEAMNEKAQDRLFDWYKYRLNCRLVPNGAIVLIMNRWCENDFAGRLLKEEPNQWEVMKFPAICYKENDNEYDPRKVGEALWPERHPIKDLERIKKFDPVFFESAYQQCPI